MDIVLYYAAIGSTALVMVLVGYQCVLAAGAFFFRGRVRRQAAWLPSRDDQLPPVTILVPAHNEALVIERTVRTLLSLRYPAGKLTLMVINDASTDGTGAILDRLHAEDPRVCVYHRQKPEGGLGKAAALNAAVSRVQDEFLAIYDADNRPDPDSLAKLMARFALKPGLAAAVGQFRCGNKRRNFLTRCVNIEGLCFQGIVQAGRQMLLGIAFLTGTNYVIRRSALLQVGGWDEEALAEDSELSTRLYMARLRVEYVPGSQTWEQEPETLKVWLKQRTRWARGNNYAVLKILRRFGASRDKARTTENLVVLTMSYVFLGALAVSQATLVLSVAGLASLQPAAGWLVHFWTLTAFFYLAQIGYTLSREGEATPGNLVVGALMYFFYGYLWMIPVVRALYHDMVLRKARTWDKTVRFETSLETDPGV